MRVTNRMLANNYMRDVSKNLNRMQTLNNQLTSGKEISRPSDNPFKVARSMQLHADIQTNKQYNENIKDTTNYLDTTDVALDQITNTFQRIRELMVSSGNAAYGSDEKRAINDEINEKIAEVGQILNTSFDGKYIFSGSSTSSKPVDIKVDPNTGNKSIVYIDKNGVELPLDSEDKYIQSQLQMIGEKLPVEVSQGVTVDYNFTAVEILQFKDEKGNNVNVMDLLNEITNNLNSPNQEDQEKLVKENLETIDAVMGNLMKKRSEVGAMQNRMEAAQTRNEEENFNLKDILSQTEDIDFTEKTMEHSMAMTIYMASLQISGKILPQTIMDFIR
ncbi:MAG: flagellar hook-associated protein FlgL [Clostridium sp.]